MTCSFVVHVHTPHPQSRLTHIVASASISVAAHFEVPRPSSYSFATWFVISAVRHFGGALPFFFFFRAPLTISIDSSTGVACVRNMLALFDTFVFWSANSTARLIIRGLPKATKCTKGEKRELSDPGRIYSIDDCGNRHVFLYFSAFIADKRPPALSGNRGGSQRGREKEGRTEKAKI